MNIEHVVAFAFQDSLFPEIIECFGLEKAIQFVKIFGGTAIEVPSAASIQYTMRDFDIYQQLRPFADSPLEFEAVGKKLGIEYSQTIQEITIIFTSMHSLNSSKLEQQVRGWKSRVTKPRTRMAQAGVPMADGEADV